MVRPAQLSPPNAPPGGRPATAPRSQAVPAVPPARTRRLRDLDRVGGDVSGVRELRVHARQAHLHAVDAHVARDELAPVQVADAELLAHLARSRLQWLLVPVHAAARYVPDVPVPIGVAHQQHAPTVCQYALHAAAAPRDQRRAQLQAEPRGAVQAPHRGHAQRVHGPKIRMPARRARSGPPARFLRASLSTARDSAGAAPGGPPQNDRAGRPGVRPAGRGNSR